MEIRYFDTEIRKGSACFGAALFGGSESLSVVTVSFPDGRSWIISPNQTRVSDETVARYAAALCGRARRMATDQSCERFLGEVLAYVRGLPDGRKSNFLTSPDKYLVKDAEADVADALSAALQRDDPYRAAVDFETRVPYLVADRGLVDVMDAVHAAFLRDYAEDEWIAAAADETEEFLCREQPYVASQAAAWKSSAGGAFSSV